MKNFGVINFEDIEQALIKYGVHNAVQWIESADILLILRGGYGLCELTLSDHRKIVVSRKQATDPWRVISDIS